MVCSVSYAIVNVCKCLKTTKSANSADIKKLSQFAEEEVKALIQTSKAFLTEYENLSIKELNEEDFIIASLIIWSCHKEKNNIKTIRLKSGTTEEEGNWDRDRVISCISAALGLTIIDGLISNTATLMTVQGVTELLTTLGKRYLGWIGVGVAVYEFGSCMDAW